MTAEQNVVPAQVWAAFIQKLKEAGDGNYNSLEELQKLCLRSAYAIEDLHAALMTTWDHLSEIKGDAEEGMEKARAALEDLP
jgi:hypothetical protein